MPLVQRGMSPAHFTNAIGNIYVCVGCMYISVCEHECVCRSVGGLTSALSVTPQELSTLFIETGSLTAMEIAHLARLGVQ